MASSAYFTDLKPWGVTPNPYPHQPFAKDQHQTEARLSGVRGQAVVLKLCSYKACLWYRHVFWYLAISIYNHPKCLEKIHGEHSQSTSHQFLPSSSHTDELRRRHLPICSSINITAVAVSIKQNHQRHELIHPPQHNSQHFIPIILIILIVGEKTPKPFKLF